ncbi:MAG: hypothetical protein R2682_05010 [Pyrinomonadaceae bacterium]
MTDEHASVASHNPDADLGLGCGLLETEFAKIKKGDTVIDLGSGAGNDCFRRATRNRRRTRDRPGFHARNDRKSS